MSPRWRDELAVYLAPHRIALARRAGGLRRRVVAAAEVQVPAPGGLEGALARLSELLEGEAWRGAAARVVVADLPWVRYAVVPWAGARLDAAGRLAQARFALGDAFGDAVADWPVTLADTPPGEPGVACALAPGLRGGLEGALAPARIRLASLRPRLAVAYGAWRRRLPADDAWFVSVEEGSLAAVYLRRGAWSRVHLARVPADWTVELGRLQALGRATGSGGGAGRILVDAPARLRRGAPAEAGLTWLERPAGEGEPAHELALLQGVPA